MLGEIDALIERRARGRDKANELAALWKESERKHRERRREELREEWRAFYLHTSELHARLSEENATKAAALLEGAT